MCVLENSIKDINRLFWRPMSRAAFPEDVLVCRCLEHLWLCHKWRIHLSCTWPVIIVHRRGDQQHGVCRGCCSDSCSLNATCWGNAATLAQQQQNASIWHSTEDVRGGGSGFPGLQQYSQDNRSLVAGVWEEFAMCWKSWTHCCLRLKKRPRKPTKTYLLPLEKKCWTETNSR